MSLSEFEPELQALDKAPAPSGATVFYGSSSIRLWENIESAFPGFEIVNRGFGGSTLFECIQLLPRLIYPLSPAALVLYAADNDLDHGASPEQTESLFHQFMRAFRQHFPNVPMAYVSIKPSPARFWNIANIRRANALIQNAAGSYPDVQYLDVFSLMLSPAGRFRPELFTADGLHMNGAGYDLWRQVIRGWIDDLPAATHRA